jgi:hypothetical protein
VSWLTDLLKEYPALTVARERLALVEERLRQLEEEKKHLQAENARLGEDLRTTKQQLEELQKKEAFIEDSGVLWKKDNSGRILPYCPTCRLALSKFPPMETDLARMRCSKCKFQAPFHPREQETIAGRLSELIETRTKQAL